MMKNQRKVVFSISQISAIILAGGVTCSVFADPVIDNVAAGQVSIQQSPGSTVVNQSSQQAIINWQSFNIGHGESAHFNQPVGGVALNRINPSQGASQIYGSLTSTGQIILMNPAGFYFGPSAYVNVGGMIATTANISDQNFMNGLYQFSKVDGYNGAIVNEGQLIAAQNGLIALVAPGVINRGLIQATVGKVVLGSADAFTLDFSGDHLINFAIDAKTSARGVDKDGHELADGVNNTGAILADGGSIILSAQSVAGVLDHSINLAGVTQAQSVAQQNGEVILSGDTQDSVVKINGEINVSGKQSNETGGTIQITGYNLLLDTASRLDTSGDAGGGSINIGGGFQGQGSIAHARATVLLPGGLITADAINTGNGGNVILWSDTVTRAYGSISANGGALSGNGGLIETSSKNSLDVNGLHVSTFAPSGEMGMWLLDPRNVTITDTATTGGTFNGASPNVFTPTGDDSTVLNTTIEANLATASVTINTGADGAQAGVITVNAPITWSSANTLLLQAAAGTGTIVINNPITATAGTLTLNAPNVAGSITTGADGAINVATFNLTSGQWLQVSATLPAFNATNFNLALTNTAFTRAIGGDGAAMTPYQITDVYGLSGIVNPNNYVLANDIDASATTGWTTTNGFRPLANYSNSFDGQNHSITNLYIGAPVSSRSGLFRTLLSGSVVNNLNMVGGSVTGTLNTFAGSIAGTVNAGALVDNVTSTMSITNGVGAISQTGGIAGQNSGTISNSSFSGSVANGSQIGGIAGGNSGTLSNVTNNGTLSATGNYASLLFVGGITGYNTGSISNVLNTASILNILPSGAVSPLSVGGIVGEHQGGAINNATNTGDIVVSNTVATSFNMGGIAGVSFGDLTNSKNSGSLTLLSSASMLNRIGGVVGNASGSNYTNLINTGDITSDEPSRFLTIGGIISTCTSSGVPLQNLFNSGNIVAHGAGVRIGGILGSTGNLILDTVGNSGNLTGIASNSSYISGIFNGNIILSNAYNSGNVSLTIADLGVEGRASGIGYGQGVISITNAYNAGAVTSNSGSVGIATSGIIQGDTGAPLVNVYNSGYISGSSPDAIGLNNVDVTDSFYDSDTSGAGTTSAATALTTAQMQASGNFTNWDFGTVWNIELGESFPYLQSFYAAPPTIITGNAAPGSNVGLIVNGVSVPVSVGADGVYYAIAGNNLVSGQDATLTAGEKAISFVESGGQVGNLIYTLPASSTYSLPAVTLNQITVGDGTVGTYTSADLASIVGNLSSGYALYTASGNNITLGNGSYQNVNLVIPATTTFNSLGTILTYAGGTSTATFNGVTTLAGNVTTNGVQTYNAATTFAGDITLDVGNHNFVFNNSFTPNGAGQTLTLNGGGAMGFDLNTFGASLATLTINNVAGTFDIGNAYSTGGNLAFNTSLNLTANTSLTTGGDLSITQKINRTAGATKDLILNAGAGLITIADNIGDGVNGALGSLSFTTTGTTTLNGTINSTSMSTAAGLTVLDGASVTTSGNQTYNGALTLASVDKVLTSSGAVTFNNTVNVNRNLAVNAASTNFLGALTGNSAITVTGAGGNAGLTVQAANNQTFNIAGSNAGTVTGLGGYAGAFNFTNTQNIVGGLLGNTFHFADNATLTGTLNGNNLGQTNTIDITAYNQNMNIEMTNTNNGLIKNAANTTIANYSNITTTNANITNTNTITAPAGKASTLTVTDGGIGYINDPIYFNGFNYFVGPVGSIVDFTVPYTFNSGTGIYTVNGVQMFMNGFAIYSPPSPTPAQIPSVVANVIQQPPTNASQNNNSPTSTSSTVTPVWVLAGTTVDQNLTIITTQAANDFDNLTQKVKVNPYCYATQ